MKPICFAIRAMPAPRPRAARRLAMSALQAAKRAIQPHMTEEAFRTRGRDLNVNARNGKEETR